MANRSYNHATVPIYGSPGTSGLVRLEFEALETGFAVIEAEIDTLADGTGIDDGAITYSKIDFVGTLVEGSTLVWRASSSKFVVEPVIGGGTDTYQVKLDADDSAEYLIKKLQYLGAM